MQIFAKVMLFLFYFPFVPARDPGTSYAPSVSAAEENKTGQNIIWCFLWFAALTEIPLFAWIGYVAAFLGTNELQALILLFLAWVVFGILSAFLAQDREGQTLASQLQAFDRKKENAAFIDAMNKGR